ncbi:MAG: monofunctional biosynthetic peptidoglycan transglycosylase [Paracoccaceae bacterium]
MAQASKKKPAGKGSRSKASRAKARVRPARLALKWLLRGALAAVALLFLAVLGYAVFNPPVTPYMAAEARRLGGVDHIWVDFEEIAPVMARSVVAGEDANYCLHWGFDMAAIRDALEDGSGRGASTISQQVVKNAYLWQGRSWARKALEAVMTPAVELVWTKRRILEVYLNVAEFGEGVFGVEAAARTYFRVGPGELTATQAARLAAVLPSPKKRSAANPSPFVRRRAAAIADGAATILADGRAACFES